MKNKAKIIDKKEKIIAVFSLLYTVFFSLGVMCFCGAMMLSVSSSMDHVNPWNAHPYFMPFCVITGQIALAVLIVGFIVNIILSRKSGMTFKSWLFEFLCPIVLMLPMMLVWTLVFGVLRKIF